jgi:GTPase SAR1 family protein
LAHQGIHVVLPNSFAHERTHSPPSPLPGSGAVVYAFSTTDRESFLAVENWKRKVDEECGDIPCVLVQNKIDMLAQAQVDPYVL